MKQQDFSKLRSSEQLDIVRNDGVYIGKRVFKNRKVILYQVHSFYVELYYRSYRKELSSILISEDLEILQPYLHQVEVPIFSSRFI